jgi:uncharacterized membrane protein
MRLSTGDLLLTLTVLIGIFSAIFIYLLSRKNPSVWVIVAGWSIPVLFLATWGVGGFKQIHPLVMGGLMAFMVANSLHIRNKRFASVIPPNNAFPEKQLELLPKAFWIALAVDAVLTVVGLLYYGYTDRTPKNSSRRD